MKTSDFKETVFDTILGTTNFDHAKKGGLDEDVVTRELRQSNEESFILVFMQKILTGSTHERPNLAILS